MATDRGGLREIDGMSDAVQRARLACTRLERFPEDDAIARADRAYQSLVVWRASAAWRECAPREMPDPGFVTRADTPRFLLVGEMADAALERWANPDEFDRVHSEWIVSAAGKYGRPGAAILKGEAAREELRVGDPDFLAGSVVAELVPAAVWPATRWEAMRAVVAVASGGPDLQSARVEMAREWASAVWLLCQGAEMELGGGDVIRAFAEATALSIMGATSPTIPDDLHLRAVAWRRSQFIGELAKLVA